jgi:hypothetical protein
MQLGKLLAVPEVCRIYCATANPTQVITRRCVNASFDSNLMVHANRLVMRLPLSCLIRRALQKTGAKMAKAKKTVRREWTKADVKQLKTMAKARAGVTKISKSLKRTPGATSVMAAKLGVSLSMRP